MLLSHTKRAPHLTSPISRTLLILVAYLALVGGMTPAASLGVTTGLAPPVSAERAAKADGPGGLFRNATPEGVMASRSRRAVEVGMTFSPVRTTFVTGVQFFKAAASASVTPTNATLWNGRGKRIARAAIPAESGTGWVSVSLSRSVKVIAGRAYTISIHAPRGRYAVTKGEVSTPMRRNGLVVRAQDTGLRKFTEKPALPASGMGLHNYWVDVVTGQEMHTTDLTTESTPTSAGERRGWHLDATSTGLAGVGLKCADLPVYEGSETVPAGTVISRMRITSPLVLSPNSVLEESCIQPTQVGQGLPVVSTTGDDDGGSGVLPATIRDSEIDGSLLKSYLAAWTTGFIGVANVQRTYVHHVGSGIAMMNTGQRFSAVVEGNYVDDLVAWGNPGTTGNHSDAFTVRDFDGSADPNRSLLVRNNRFVCDSGSDTGAIFIQTYSGNIDNVMLSGNLLEGRGYQLGLESGFDHSYSGMRAINNRFSGTSYGPTYVNGPGWVEWSSNHINAPGAANNVGKVIPRP